MLLVGYAAMIAADLTFALVPTVYGELMPTSAARAFKVWVYLRMLRFYTTVTPIYAPHLSYWRQRRLIRRWRMPAIVQQHAAT